MDATESFKRFQGRIFVDRQWGLFALDYSRMGFDDSLFSHLEGKVEGAVRNIREIEAGGQVNIDERRMVGHYWLRNPELAPSSEIKEAIVNSHVALKEFVAKIGAGELGPTPLRHVLVIGIGGSALGPQFVSAALGRRSSGVRLAFFDNTDPDGMLRTLGDLELGSTLAIVISKSGGTKETRNGMLVFEQACVDAGLDPAKHMVAVTSTGSDLDKYATSRGWLGRLPMWDWVGGRTSETSVVGLLPAALEGIDIDLLLAGARYMDGLTRREVPRQNPAMILALAWYHAGCGRGLKDMVVLPYCDRLELFSRYLQQLVMESLGKEFDLGGNVIHQGISVFGNKGSTDQHAFVQQLRDGIANFFTTFIEVIRDISPVAEGNSRELEKLEIEEGVTCGDYLQGFLQGTKEALSAKGRESLTITIEQVDEFWLGALIALFERAVGIYASFVNINAYHQPGVEAGKKAAGEVIELQRRVVELLARDGRPRTVAEVRLELGDDTSGERVFHILQHLGGNGRVKIEKSDYSVFEDRFFLEVS